MESGPSVPGIGTLRQNAFTSLRHTYASVLLDGGDSIKSLAAYLGHGDPVFFTLRITPTCCPARDRTRSIRRGFRDDPPGRDGL